MVYTLTKYSWWMNLVSNETPRNSLSLSEMGGKTNMTVIQTQYIQTQYIKTQYIQTQKRSCESHNIHKNTFTGSQYLINYRYDTLHKMWLMFDVQSWTWWGKIYRHKKVQRSSAKSHIHKNTFTIIKVLVCSEQNFVDVWRSILNLMGGNLKRLQDRYLMIVVLTNLENRITSTNQMTATWGQDLDDYDNLPSSNRPQLDTTPATDCNSTPHQRAHAATENIEKFKIWILKFKF